ERQIPPGSRGFTLIDSIIVTVVIVLCGLLVARTFLSVTKSSVNRQDKAFASQKAIQMMEELRGLLVNTDATVAILDDYDDGNQYRYVLTTKLDAATGDPGDPASGNAERKYVRQINVIRLP